MENLFFTRFDGHFGVKKRHFNARFYKKIIRKYKLISSLKNPVK